MSRPIQATLSPQALRNNLAVVRRVAPQARVWAVVKANAYGHGLARVWQALATADGFAVLDLAEAILLRDAGWAGPVLLLEGFFKAEELQTIAKYQLTTTVHSVAQLAMLEDAVAHGGLKHPVPIQLKMNSGMNRLGFAPADYAAAWQRAKACSGVGSITLMMHFSDADSPKGIAQQMAVFEKAAAGLPGERSFANSAGILWHAEAHADWVRPGVMLYGASPTGRAADIATSSLQAVMTLRSEIIAVQDLQAGESVGYGSRFVAQRPMRIGVVACGYADGYPRTAKDGTPVWLEAQQGIFGRRCGLVGQVSMDMLTIDLSEAPQAEVGYAVELWGQYLPIDDVANGAGTIGYELMCALAQRVPVSVLADAGEEPSRG